MKAKLGIIGAIIASITSCVKIETYKDPESYDSIIEYAVNSKDVVNNVLFGPVEICPDTWVNIDTECRVQIDNERILVINRSITDEGKQRVKTLVLHYQTKKDIANDFKRIEKLEEDNAIISTHMRMSALSAEYMSTDLHDKVKVDLTNVGVDFTFDTFNKEFYYLIIRSERDDEDKVESYIIIPAEFV